MNGSGRLLVFRVVTVDRDTLVTAVQIEQQIPTVSRHLVYLWRRLGKLLPVDRQGRSPRYRWGDVLDVERSTRQADPAGQRRTMVA